MKTYSGFIDDMGTIGTHKGKNLSDILPSVNSMRDHAGMPHLTLADLQRFRRSGKIKCQSSTVVEYVIQGNYGQGWEDENTEETLADACRSLKEYRANGPGIYRRITRRVPRV